MNTQPIPPASDLRKDKSTWESIGEIAARLARESAEKREASNG